MNRWVYRIGFHPRWLSALAALGIAGVTWAAVWGPSHPAKTAQGHPERLADNWVVAILVVSLVLAVTGLVFLTLSYQQRWEARNADRRSQRVKRLTQSLSEALEVIEGIRFEVEEGEKLLLRLKKDTEVNRELAELSQTEAVAVNTALVLALRRDRLRGTIPTVAINLGCGVVGVVIGHFIF